MIPTSLYIHIPFCIHRCGYCDFNTYADQQSLILAYSEALCKELEYLGTSNPGHLQIHTIYFGGGTPSLLPSDQINLIIRSIKQHFIVPSSIEITMEANPGTVSLDFLCQVREAGINRLSLGMQSAHQDELTLLERQHSFDDVVSAVRWARQAGFVNVSLDLIFGLPAQGLNSWLASLDTALSLQPEHLSLYALTLEHGTPLKHKIDAGELPQPDADLAADMYEAARERLSAAGFIHYEISNWAYAAASGEIFYCKHNLQYWCTLPYIGVGAGAHGFINHYRTVNVATPRAYINRMKRIPGNFGQSDSFPRSPAAVQINFISADTEIGEFMMMGLRLISEGVSNREFKTRYGLDLMEKYGSQIERFVSISLLEWNGYGDQHLCLTQKGHLLGNQVFREFV